MPQARTTGATDATSDAQGRFTVQLSAELRPIIEKLIAKQSAAVVAAGGLPMDVSMAQVVTGLIRLRGQELDAQEAQAKAEANTDGKDKGKDES